MEKELNNNQNGNETAQKESLAKRFIRGYDKFKTGKVGKWVVRTAKGIGLAAGGFGLYKAGQASVKPVTVYVERLPDQTEEKPEEEKTEETTTEA